MGMGGMQGSVVDIIRQIIDEATLPLQQRIVSLEEEVAELRKQLAEVKTKS